MACGRCSQAAPKPTPAVDPLSVFQAAQKCYDDGAFLPSPAPDPPLLPGPLGPTLTTPLAPWTAVRKDALLAASAALGLAATTKKEALEALDKHFVDAAAAAAAAAIAPALDTHARAMADFDDVEMDELLEACATLGLGIPLPDEERDRWAIGTRKREAFESISHYVNAKAENKQLDERCSGCSTCCGAPYCRVRSSYYCSMCR